MFGKNTLKQEDINFLLDDNSRIKFQEIIVENIIRLVNDFHKENKPNGKVNPYCSIYINYDINRNYLHEDQFCVKLKYNNLTYDTYTSIDMLKIMYRILRKMKLNFQVRYFVQDEYKDDSFFFNLGYKNHKFEIGYLAENGMWKIEKGLTNKLPIPTDKDKLLQYFTEENLNKYLIYLVQEMFSNIAKELSKQNNSEDVTIFYGV